jgi:hypothetical protein
MTRLDDDLAGLHTWRSNVAGARESGTGPRGPARYGTHCRPSAVERVIRGPPSTGELPASATEPGITSGASVADGLKSARHGPGPGPSNLRVRPPPFPSPID